MLLDQYKNEILNMYNEDESLCSLAKKYNTTHGVISRSIVRWGYDLKTTKRTKKQMEDVMVGVLDEFNSGKSIYEIAKLRNVEDCVIGKRLKKLGIDTSRYDTNKYKTPLSVFKDEILSDYATGISSRKLAKKYDCRPKSIRDFLRRCGVEIRPFQKYHVKQEFFEVIDSSNKAYLLGWLYSDGNVQKDVRGWSLAICDFGAIKQVKSMIDYAGPIYKVKKQVDKEHYKDKYRLNVSDTKMAKDLVKLGCMPAKSLILDHPTVEQVPEHLLSHFYRGILEGDGSIMSKKKQCRVSITCNDLFLNKMCEVLAKKNIHTFMRSRKTYSTTKELIIYRKESCKLFLDWIYSEAPVVLARKYKKYGRFCRKNGWQPVLTPNQIRV